VIGASVGALILASRPPGPLLVIWLALFALALPYGQSRNYGLFTVFFAPLVVLLIDLLANDGWHLAQDRLIDALLGCGIALLIGYAPWPSSWHGSWRPTHAQEGDRHASSHGQRERGSAGQACRLRPDRRGAGGGDARRHPAYPAVCGRHKLRWSLVAR
jgi:hypothetical protein